MTTLHFGVVDIPYAQSRAAATRRTTGARTPTAPSSNTTGDVAEILERRYGVLQAFYDLHGERIADVIAEALESKLENILLSAPVDTSVVLEEGTLSEIEELFRKMLDNRELDGRIDGVPTRASLLGVSHRFQRPYVRRGARPSFIDTGAYQAAFRAWMD